MDKAEKIQCPDCGAAISNPEGRLELMCECGTVLISEEQEYAEHLKAEELARKWYYARSKEKFGPVPMSRLRQMIGHGKIGPDDLVWTRGMKTWRKVRCFQELVECLPKDLRAGISESDERVSISAESWNSFGAVPAEKASRDREESTAEKSRTPTLKVRDFMIQVSAGLMASLAFFQVAGIAAAVHAVLTNRISHYFATWLIAAFTGGAVVCMGVSQLIRLFHDRLGTGENS